MQERGWFSTPISCGALAGIGAGVLWAYMTLSFFKEDPQSLKEFLLRNAFMESVGVGACLCGAAIYMRDVALAFKAMGCALLFWIAAAACNIFSWWISGSFPALTWETRWHIFELTRVLIICPMIGVGCGIFLSRLYGLPQLRWKGILFGMLGCAVHWVFSVFMPVAVLGGVNMDTREMTAMYGIVALLGYAFLGAVAEVPFDVYFREKARDQAALEVVDSEGLR